MCFAILEYKRVKKRKKEKEKKRKKKKKKEADHLARVALGGDSGVEASQPEVWGRTANRMWLFSSNVHLL